MATIDVDYVTLTAIIGAAIGDTAADPDTNPDWVTATEGTVTFTPNIEAVNATNDAGKTVRVVPFPIVCLIDAQGRLTYNGDPSVTLMDLGSSKVNPSIPRDKAAYNVAFKGVKMNAAAVSLSSFGINPDPADAVSGSINLWDIAPLSTGAGGAPIVRGQGVPSITAATADDVVTYDGTDIVWQSALSTVKAGQPDGVAALDGEGLVPVVQPSRAAPHLYLTQRSRMRQIPVVMMHNFISELAALGLLKDYVAWGYEGIWFSDLVHYLTTGDDSGLPDKPICFTDDDGGQSSYTALYPALQSLGQKCTYFLVPAWINGDETAPPNGGSFMEASPITWANAQEMLTSGLIEFQSHTLTHGSMRLLSGPGQFTGNGEGAGADYLAAKSMIEANVPGAVVTCSAAPYGVINDTAIESLRSAGCVGQRITQVGTDVDGVYDGSGPFAYATPGIDPLRVPITSNGPLSMIRGDQMFGRADSDANRVQNGRALATQRGFTLPAGWTQPSVALPQGAGNGLVWQGTGTAAATPLVHTALIPVPLGGAFSLDLWAMAQNAAANAVKCQIDGYVNPTDTTPATTTTAVWNAASWFRCRYAGLADPTVSWLKLSFYLAGASSSSVLQLWDIRLRCTRSIYA